MANLVEHSRVDTGIMLFLQTLLNYKRSGQYHSFTTRQYC